jgi:hypothetical protein
VTVVFAAAIERVWCILLVVPRVCGGVVAVPFIGGFDILKGKLLGFAFVRYLEVC